MSRNRSTSNGKTNNASARQACGTDADPAVIRINFLYLRNIRSLGANQNLASYEMAPLDPPVCRCYPYPGTDTRYPGRQSLLHFPVHERLYQKDLFPGRKYGPLAGASFE